MSKTSIPQCPLPTVTFDTQMWYTARPGLQDQLVLAALSFALYGIFFGLCTVSIYFLVRNSRNNERARRTTVTLALVLLALFASTTAYTVALFLVARKNLFSDVITWGLQGFWFSVDVVYDPAPVPISAYAGTTGYVLSCVPTAALTINVWVPSFPPFRASMADRLAPQILLGDAIVCWRACVIWQGKRLVTGTCVVLLLATFALGIVDTNASCGTGMGGLYQDFPYGVAATVLSLATNLFATVAVAFRAWKPRKELKKYLAIGGLSQVEWVLSLLVESGVVYCALWILVIAWQAGMYGGPGAGRAYRTYDNFWGIFDVFMDGALVPTIAIYPTVIIVLVSLNRSHVEKGFVKTEQHRLHLPSLALRRPITDEIVTTRRETPPRGPLEVVLDVDEKDLGLSNEDVDDSSTHTVEP